MRITLTSSLGNIGEPLAKQLIDDGHVVTIISHSIDQKSEIEGINAIAKIGSLEDLDFLTSAFNEADALFLMNPRIIPKLILESITVKQVQTTQRL